MSVNPDAATPAAPVANSPALPVEEAKGRKDALPSISGKVLDLGFKAGLGLTLINLLAAMGFLYLYLSTANQKLDGLDANTKELVGDSLPALTLKFTFICLQYQAVRAKVTLLACGICSALAVAFLGFILYLVGATREMDVSGTSGGSSVAFNRITPGTLVMVCSLVLIGVCSTHVLSFGGQIGDINALNMIEAPAAKFVATPILETKVAQSASPSPSTTPAPEATH